MWLYEMFLLYMKKPCATSTPRTLRIEEFAVAPFDIKA